MILTIRVNRTSCFVLQNCDISAPIKSFLHIMYFLVSNFICLGSTELVINKSGSFTASEAYQHTLDYKIHKFEITRSWNAVDNFIMSNCAFINKCALATNTIQYWGRITQQLCGCHTTLLRSFVSMVTHVSMLLLYINT